MNENTEYEYKVYILQNQMFQVQYQMFQGTVLAPLLYKISFNDIDNGIESKVLSFADDTQICKSIRDISDIIALQNNSCRIYEWYKNNNMKFNIEKFQLLRYGKHNNLKTNHYTLPDGTCIEDENILKDLEIIMTNNVEFDTHNEIETNKGRRLIKNKEIMKLLLKR